MDECLAAVDQVMGAMIAELDSLPARFTRDLAEHDRLERLINEARRQVVKKRTDVEGQIKTNGTLDGDDIDDDDRLPEQLTPSTARKGS